MYMSAGHGKCVNVIHAMGDQLCQLGAPLMRPDLGPPRTEKLSDESAANSLGRSSEETGIPAESSLTLEERIASVELKEEVGDAVTNAEASVCLDFR